MKLCIIVRPTRIQHSTLFVLLPSPDSCIFLRLTRALARIRAAFHRCRQNNSSHRRRPIPPSIYSITEQLRQTTDEPSSSSSRVTEHSSLEMYATATICLAGKIQRPAIVNWILGVRRVYLYAIAIIDFIDSHSVAEMKVPSACTQFNSLISFIDACWRSDERERIRDRPLARTMTTIGCIFLSGSVYSFSLAIKYIEIPFS